MTRIYVCVTRMLFVIPFKTVCLCYAFTLKNKYWQTKINIGSGLKSPVLIGH